MSYLVLARKYRPQSFDALIGQDHIAQLLKNAVQSDRLAHAYLFCGPRGIGKTSCARILAKSLNCEKGPTLKPCGKCSACQEIAAGTSFDVLEIDGASNRGIDEIRTLRENVKFAPSYGRYKVYIVDEVHMLTQEAFNALLKTLEEPPAHVKFIFATTAPQKVPATIISRCQRFDFKHIPIKTIVETLTDISKTEKFKIDQDALYAIAKAAQGSMRDALSILDQLSALTDRQITSSDVFTMLGMVETEYLFALTDALGDRNCAQALEILEKIIDDGKDIKQFSQELIEHFRNLMIIKIGGKALGRLVDYPVAIKEMILSQTKKFTLKDILQAIDAFIEARDTARVTESLRMPLEMAFAKLTYQGEPVPEVGGDEPAHKAQAQAKAANVHKHTKATEAKPLRTKPSPVQALKSQSGQISISGEPAEDSSDDAASDTEDDVDFHANMAEGIPTYEKIKKSWDALTYAVSREKMSLATFLQEGYPAAFRDSKLTIGFPPRCAFQKETLEEQNNVKLVERVLSKKLNADIIIEYKIYDETQSKEEEPGVQSVLNTFKGKVISRWHKE